MSATSDFYLARAEQNAYEARECNLANVRDRYLHSQAVWQALADRVLISETTREAQLAEKIAKQIS
ncbi:MAG: hypothetical protein E2598_05580 [Sphingobium sp.]|nr:hypothetical protein [Sphingobium sp.]